MKLDASYMKYLGTSYLYGGNDVDGIDCINLCTLVGRDRGVLIPNVNHQHKTFNNYHSLFDIRNDVSNWIKVQAQPDVLVVFRVSGRVGHVGYMLDSRRFIHILEGSSVTIERVDDAMWEKRIVGFYQYIGD